MFFAVLLYRHLYPSARQSPEDGLERFLKVLVSERVEDGIDSAVGVGQRSKEHD